MPFAVLELPNSQRQNSQRQSFDLTQLEYTDSGAKWKSRVKSIRD
jgi:hypothetical protein